MDAVGNMAVGSWRNTIEGRLSKPRAGTLLVPVKNTRMSSSVHMHSPSGVTNKKYLNEFGDLDSAKSNELATALKSCVIRIMVYT